mgnify:CR=1 FL=1
MLHILKSAFGFLGLENFALELEDLVLLLKLEGIQLAFQVHGIILLILE